MARKKKSEMTLLERVDSVMKGESWEFAEQFGIEVLARCMALHIYARKDGEEYITDLMRRICIRGDQWAHEPGVPFILAMAAIGQKIQEAGGVEEYMGMKRN